VKPSLETLRLLLPWLVGGIIPFFFLLVYAGSCFSRLTALRTRSARHLQEIREALRTRLTLAERLLQRAKQDSDVSAGTEWQRTEENARRLAAWLTDETAPRPDAGLSASAEPLREALQQFEDGLRTFLRKGSGGNSKAVDVVDPGWKRELADNEAALLLAASQYNQAVDDLMRKRTAFPERWLGTFVGCGPLERFPMGEGERLPASQRRD